MKETKYDLGLVLEGGAMRGIYTAGVLDVLMENGVKADMVIGTSAGCIHGCCYVSGQAGRSIRYYRKYRHDQENYCNNSFDCFHVVLQTPHTRLLLFRPTRHRLNVVPFIITDKVFGEIFSHDFVIPFAPFFFLL